MRRIDELDDQIAKLQAEREQLLAAERKQALEEVKRTIARFQFTPDELSDTKAKRKRRTKAEMAAARAAA